MEEKLKTLFTWPEEKPNVPTDTHHWFGEGNRFVLDFLIKELNPKVILEMGSWTGAGSSSFILNAAPNSHVICVDHWSKDLQDYIQKYGPQLEEILENRDKWDSWGINKIDTLWETFLVNTWEHRHHLYPVRKKSEEALPYLKNLGIEPELIYIDAHHDYESVLNDITTSVEYWPNAAICGDDYRWPDGGIAKAVHECAEKYNFDVFGQDQCWFYKKK